MFWACTLAITNFAIRGGLVGGADKGPDFWELEFVRTAPTAAIVRVDNRQPCRRSITTNGLEQVYGWHALSLPEAPHALDVYAHVTTHRDGTMSWELALTNRATCWALLKTRYPYLRHICPTGVCDVLYPGNHLGAKVIRNWRWANRVRAYPGTLPMVTAFMHNGHGLYCAAHDGEGRLKELHWSNKGDCWFETTVENAGLAQAANGPGYPVVTAPFTGDWWQAAKIYRAWALQQKWCAKGPLATRADYPTNLINTVVWWRLSRNLRPDDAVELVHRTWPDLKTGLRYYGWNKERFDTYYPEFTPRADAPHVIARARAKGVTVLPYVNGKIWDSALPTYAGMRRWFVQTRAGKEITENYSGRPFGVVCPGAECWHEKLARMRTLVIDEVGSNGIYYDQIGIAVGHTCWAPDHGHPVGGGRWWAAGYRTALAPIRAKCAACGYPIATEGFNETLVDLVDAFLICGRQETAEDVPFHPAIYAGYTTFFNAEENETDAPAAFFALQARALMHGIVSGTWREHGLFDGRLAEQSAIIRRLALVRREMRNYLALGFLADELRPREPLPAVTYTYSPTRPQKKNAQGVTITYPAVIGNVWETYHRQQTAIFAANVSAHEQTVTFDLPHAAAAWQLHPLPEQSAAVFERAGPARGRLRLKPYAVACVESK